MIRLPASISHFLQKIPFFQPSDPQLQELVNPIVLEKSGLTANHWIAIVASFAIPIFRDFVIPVAGRLWRAAPKMKVDEAHQQVSNPSSVQVPINRITGSIELVVGVPRDLFSAAVVGVSLYNGSLESLKSFVLPLLVGALSIWDLTKRALASRRIRKESPELSFGQRWLEKRKYLGIFPER